MVPRIVGDDHLKPRLSGGLPFAVGQVNPRRGYVHVLDDNSLLLLLNTLNTVTDFVEYLTRKEQFVLSGRLEMAAGEEELLGYYYKDVGPDGFNDFVFPPEAEHIVLPEGHWDYFQKSPQRRAQLELDRISELWDAIIERFNRNALGGTLHYASGSGLSGHERAVRFMARERRTRRRMLAEGLAGLLSKTARDQRGVRMVAPSEPSDPLYVFLLIPKLPGQLEDEYREQRRNVLLMHALIAKLHFPEVEDIVGLATETGLDNGGRSEDLLYYDARGWTEEAEREARELQRQTGWLTNVERSEGTEYQFPPLEEAARRFPGPRISAKGKERNDKCPCGSGKKVKKCCGSKQR